jgi:hypothetical protein
LLPTEISLINKVGCASHSSAPSGQCPHWLIGRVMGENGDTNEYFCNISSEQEIREKVLNNLILHCKQLVKDAKEEENFKPKDAIDAALYIKEGLESLRSKQGEP